jgi:hypothetical protein
VTSRLESAGDHTYVYTPEAPLRAAERWRAIARAHVADEVTREPVRDRLRVSVEGGELVARIGSGGIVGIVGRPARLFPTLGASATGIRIAIEAPGYLPLPLAGTLGPIAGFPDVYTPLDFGTALLHRPGVAIEGCVVENTAAAPPLGGATVQIAGIWSTVPPPNWVPPALEEPATLVALAPGLYAPRNVGSTISQRDLVLSAQAKTLFAAVAAGGTRALLSDRVGLAAADVLVIDRDDAAITEAIELAEVDSGASDDQPAWVTLAHPTKHVHRDGAVCTEATPQAPSNVTTFGRAAIPGDRVAALAVAPAYPSGAVVEVDDGIGVREFQRAFVYATTSGVDGCFRLPPIARVAFVRLRVQHAGFADAEPIVTLDYRSAIQRVTVAME